MKPYIKFPDLKYFNSRCSELAGVSSTPRERRRKKQNRKLGHRHYRRTAKQAGAYALLKQEPKP